MSKAPASGRSKCIARDGSPWSKEGRCLIAHAHEVTMGCALPSLIGFPWASPERSPPLLERWRHALRMIQGRPYCHAPAG
jgi:hypothetical protein